VPQNVFVPDHMSDSNDNLNQDVNQKEDDEIHSFVSYNITILSIIYDDNTASLASVDSTRVHLLVYVFYGLKRSHGLKWSQIYSALI
jgi:hypothetical protein